MEQRPRTRSTNPRTRRTGGRLIRDTRERRERWYASRSGHAGVFSTMIHTVIYVLLAVHWTQRVAIPPREPLMEGPAMSVALLTGPLDRASQPIAPSAESAAGASQAASLPKPIRPAPTPPATPVKPSPAPEKESEPRPVKVATKPVPATVPPVMTVARLLRPDPEMMLLEARPAALDARLDGDASLTSEDSSMDARADGPSEEAQDSASQDESANASPAERRRAQMGRALREIAQAASGGSGPHAVDIVFLLDISGSMENNIVAVRENLSMMMRTLEERGYDATFGIVKFAVVTIRIFPQSRDPSRFERLLDNMKVGGDERALNALDKAQRKVRFRDNVQRRFVLVTDEPFSGKPALTDLIPKLQKDGIVVDVIGLATPEHRLLARLTGGTWHPIPGEARRSGG